MDILILLVLTIPIFYIWGIVSFIRTFSKGSHKSQQEARLQSTDRKGYLKAAIVELQRVSEADPAKKISDLLKEYKAELLKIADLVLPEAVSVSASVSAVPVKSSDNLISTPPSTPSFQNWYKDNSINLLLYIGAFLIVVSATIFVGLENVLGVFKAVMITLLAALFLGSGLWFYTFPKIRNAGSAFAGIGALLIPIAGIGWYTFVFEAMGTGIGIVWLLTSLIGLFVYILLARYFKSAFYSYVASLSTLSFSFSLVNISGLESDFYMLASIMSSILLLAVSIYFKANKTADSEIFLMPVNLTANIVMPIAMLYGVILRSQSGDLFTFAATASIFLGSFFYVLSYINTKKPWQVLLALMFSSLGLIFFGNMQHFTSFAVLLLLAASVYIDLFLVYFFQKKQKFSEEQMIALFGVIKMGLIVLWAIALNLETISIICFCSLAIVVGVIMAFLRRSVYYSIFSSIITAVLLYYVINKYLNYQSMPELLGLCYLLGGIAWFIAAVYWKKYKTYVTVFGLSSGFYFFLSSIVIADKFAYQTLNTLCIAIVCIFAGRIFNNKSFVYFATLFIAFATISFLKLYEVKLENYPLVFTCLAYVYYLIGCVPGVMHRDAYRNSGLVASFTTPLLFGIVSFGSYSESGYDKHVERNSLIGSYATVILFSFDAISRASSSLGYAASAIAVFTYLWQIHFLGITNTQYYTLVLGLYFCTLAYLQRKKSDQSLRQLFDILGLGFLIFPTWIQSFGTDGMMYALLLGGIGVVLLSFGITFTCKVYKYAGILAIVLAVTSQSKWAIIGVAGLAFLGLALYLLLFRKEEKTRK